MSASLISNIPMRPRVFVSSVINGFEARRQAARKGITAVGGEAILVNEDFHALATSSRNACIDGVDSCDIYLVVIGERGGSRTPSGKLVVEEEYERARFRKMPVLAFVENCSRDSDAQELVKKLSDYIDGVFRRTFTGTEELRSQIEEALAPLVDQYQKPSIEPAMIQNILNQPYQIQNETSLRFALVPERDEEVLDVVRLDTDDVRRLLYEIGHAKEVGLFAYEHSKTTNVAIESIVILQKDSERRHRGEQIVRLEVTVGGSITIDTNVTGRIDRGSHSMNEGFVIVEGDVTSSLRSCFAFADAFFGRVDPYKRHQRFFYNVLLSGLGYRKLVTEYREQNSFNMGAGTTSIVQAFDKPRIITRDDLSSSNREVEAVMTLLRRQLRDQ